MFAIICLNVMLLISCWYLIAENQKNKTKINIIQDDLNKAIKRLAVLEEEGVTQK
ncbi:cytochrome C biogenesis protein [uncultured Gemella sp.]|uniref:cytochrome C biogenesis protein n=1 Tax=uncultured Gemella sp. TaxID=254352 RepID=UPI0028D8EC65|nr:cytochrome C biogenesis protein [uncultured Gemella sp.]